MAPNQHLDLFFKTIEPWEGAYKDVRITYLAYRRGTRLVLLQARVDFLVVDMPISLPNLKSENVVAGQFVLSEFGHKVHPFLEEALGGQLQTASGPISVVRGDGAVAFERHDSEGLANRRRITSLTVRAGAPLGPRDRTSLDWELRGQPAPFDGLPDLASEIGLDPARLDKSYLFVRAPNPAELDDASIVKGTLAQPACFLANGLKPSDLKLNYRVLAQRTVVRRAIIDGTEMDWTPAANAARGVARIEIPEGAALQCFASVGGHVHHHGWFIDPTTYPNALRTMLETYDPNLSTIRSALFDSGRRGGGDSRSVEAGIGWLMWMLGFSVAHLGANKQLEDGPDLLAVTPTLNVILVECTTGMLKTDKLARLVERRSQLRKRLDASGHSQRRIVAMVVTTLGSDGIVADRPHAERLGIMVATRESIEDTIAQTFVSQNAEHFFQQAEETITVGLQKHATTDAKEDDADR
jgi:hypothetical protein